MKNQRGFVMYGGLAIIAMAVLVMGLGWSGRLTQSQLFLSKSSKNAQIDQVVQNIANWYRSNAAVNSVTSGAFSEIFCNLSLRKIYRCLLRFNHQYCKVNLALICFIAPRITFLQFGCLLVTVLIPLILIKLRASLPPVMGSHIEFFHQGNSRVFCYQYCFGIR